MMLLQTAILCICVSATVCHICLISPRQRGTMDISKPGSPDCTRHAAPCGGQPIEMPKITYKAGETVFFKWQQNLNHYEPGYPGYMDISIASSENSTDFKTLAVVTDPYIHRQDNQQNYTAIFKMPVMMCDHCVIRARYKANKPGETTFLQCADIKVTLGSQTDEPFKFSPVQGHSAADEHKYQPLKRALQLRKSCQGAHKHDSRDGIMKLYGIAYSEFQPQRSHYVSVDTITGQLEVVNTFDFGIDTPVNNSKMFLVDEVISVDYGRNTTNLIVQTTGVRDDVAKRLYVVGTYNGSLVQYGDIFQFSGGAINALSWYTYGSSAVFRIQPAETSGNYFEVGMLVDSSYTMAARTPTPEGLYVNFQWLEMDVNNYHRAYALLGNENSLEALNARIYVFDIYDSKFIKYTELDVSRYTFMSMHSYPGSDELYAFSPGLWLDTLHAWYLVAVNPITGMVTKKCDIATPGIFARYYGGSVYQGNSNHDGYLYHVLRVEGNDADFIVKIHPGTCEVIFSEVTNLRHVHSLQMPMT